MKKKKPYKYNSKSRLTPNSQSFPFKVNTIKNDVKTNLENTLTKLRIIEEPVEEKESLDDSFLEGRFDKKEEKKRKKKEKKPVSKEELLSRVTFFKKLFLTISLVCAVFLIALYGSNYIGQKLYNMFHSARNRFTVAEKKSSNTMDDNYLFVGDFHTNQFSFSHFGWDYHYVNVSRNDLTTHMLLDNMKEMIYDYNPSVIFLEVGMVDLDNDISEEEILRNYGQIIDLIQSNRPNAVIFIESIYPINKDIDTYDDNVLNKQITNDRIRSINVSLKELSKEKGVRYLDVYSSISNRGVLNHSFTDNGVYLNQNGYMELFNVINKIVG